ncbi:MAG: NAD(P)H-flavin reductase/ferredoxin [Paracoccaceae bacterium]|jgi:NAD(P)H-flavin reductase/ferredoxin
MTTHAVTFVFEDGRIVKFDASEDDNLYFAALKNKVRILTDCLEGACATCKGVCTSGTYELDEYTDEALTQEEFDRREVLTCQMHVKSDCVIEFPYESRVALKSKPDSRKAHVAEVDMISSTVARLVVEPDADASPISFIAGQYVHLSVPGTSEHRSYSFANADYESGKYTFYIKVLEQGAMSDYMSQRAQAGDEITVTGPFGRFYLRPVDRPIVMVAGGTGLAPMLSMLDTLVANGDTDQPVRLLYGANVADELFAFEQLEKYAAKGVDLTTEFCVVDPAEGWDSATGHVTGLLRNEIMNGGDCQVYLCGPPPMIDAAESWLAENGHDPSLVHAEKFVPS